jgi:hypothetical protein
MAEIIELHPVKGEARLTTPNPPAYAGRTTYHLDGNTAPHKPCGFFVPAVQQFGLLTRRQDQGTLPVSRIGKLRFTSRNKPKVRFGTNKGDRSRSVVAAKACRPISSVAASVQSQSDTEQLTMTTLKPSTLVYLGQIQAERSSIRQSIPVESIAWHFVGIAHQAVTCALKEIVRAGGGK